jgi:hypothetical protein
VSEEEARDSTGEPNLAAYTTQIASTCWDSSQRSYESNLEENFCGDFLVFGDTDPKIEWL